MHRSEVTRMEAMFGRRSLRGQTRPTITDVSVTTYETIDTITYDRLSWVPTQLVEDGVIFTVERTPDVVCDVLIPEQEEQRLKDQVDCERIIDELKQSIPRNAEALQASLKEVMKVDEGTKGSLDSERPPSSMELSDLGAMLVEGEVLKKELLKQEERLEDLSIECRHEYRFRPQITLTFGKYQVGDAIIHLVRSEAPKEFPSHTCIPIPVETIDEKEAEEEEEKREPKRNKNDKHVLYIRISFYSTYNA